LDQRDRPEIDSFYHLSSAGIARRTCQGAACFVARHLNPSRWQESAAQVPRLYCLGKCYAAPAAADEVQRPVIEVRCRQGIVLNRIVAGGARTFEAYVRQGGYQALEKALGQPEEELLRAMEISGLRGLGGAGFPAGKKWRSVREARASRKFVVANFDEGDPGASSRRLEGVPTLELLRAAGPEQNAELQWRLAYVIASLLLPLLGIIITRFSFGANRYLALLIAVLIYFIYSNLLSISRTLVMQEALPPWLGLSGVHLGLAVLMLIMYGQQQKAFRGAARPAAASNRDTR